MAASVYVVNNYYTKNLKRMELTHSVLLAYLEAAVYSQQLVFNSQLTLSKKLGGEFIVNSFSPKGLEQRLNKIADLISNEVDFVDEDEKEDEAKELLELEPIIELGTVLIEAAELIEYAYTPDQVTHAESNFAKVHSGKINKKFHRLLDEAISKEQIEIKTSRVRAETLNAMSQWIIPPALILFVTLGLFGAYATGQNLLSDLKIFNHAAKQYGTGNLSHRMPHSKHIEFKEFGETFNRMISYIDSSQTKFLADNAALERIVKSRTIELERGRNELQETDIRRRQFITEISHELRTPLTVIQGESDVALRGEGKTKKEYRDALKIIHSQSINTGMLVSDLLFVARSEEGYVSIRQSSVDVYQLIETVCTSFESIALEKGVTFQLELEALDSIVRGDKNRLLQVLTILLDNAVRYTAEDSKVSIIAFTEDKELVIKIRDQGVGIPKKDLPNIFERFYRGKNTRSTSSGTGLGLTVAKAIMIAHGGSIELYNRANKRGVVAFLRLPLLRFSSTK